MTSGSRTILGEWTYVREMLHNEQLTELEALGIADDLMTFGVVAGITKVSFRDGGG